jgi:hypothetical protein
VLQAQASSAPRLLAGAVSHFEALLHYAGRNMTYTPEAAKYMPSDTVSVTLRKSNALTCPVGPRAVTESVTLSPTAWLVMPERKNPVKESALVLGLRLSGLRDYARMAGETSDATMINSFK